TRPATRRRRRTGRRGGSGRASDRAWGFLSSFPSRRVSGSGTYALDPTLRAGSRGKTTSAVLELEEEFILLQILEYRLADQEHVLAGAAAEGVIAGLALRQGALGADGQFERFLGVLEGDLEFGDRVVQVRAEAPLLLELSGAAGHDGLGA